MEIYVFAHQIEPELKRAIIKAGGEEMSESLFLGLKRLLGRERMLPAKVFALVERKEFPLAEELKKILSSPIENLPLSTRCKNIMRSHFYPKEDYCVNLVVFLKEADAFKIRWCGRGRVTEIRNALRLVGLDFFDCLSLYERSLIEEALRPKE